MYEGSPNRRSSYSHRYTLKVKVVGQNLSGAKVNIRNASGQTVFSNLPINNAGEVDVVLDDYTNAGGIRTPAYPLEPCISSHSHGRSTYGE